MWKEITDEFQKIKSKNKITQTQISSLINNLKDVLVKYEDNLKEIPKTDPPESQKEKASQLIDSAISEVNAMDIDKNYNSICNGFYGSLSKLGKIMVKDFTQENIDTFTVYPYDKNLFYTVPYFNYFF